MVVVVVIFTINMGMRDWISRHIDQFAMMTVVSACRVYLGKEKILLMIIKLYCSLASCRSGAAKWDVKVMV